MVYAREAASGDLRNLNRATEPPVSPKPLISSLHFRITKSNPTQNPLPPFALIPRGQVLLQTAFDLARGPARIPSRTRGRSLSSLSNNKPFRPPFLLPPHAHRAGRHRPTPPPRMTLALSLDLTSLMRSDRRLPPTWRDDIRPRDPTTSCIVGLEDPKGRRMRTLCVASEER
ncbi:uncharacterized protein A4U43_C06F13940 [Asparagus officinalis]|uniref:Uncharacterized protein n=1 Tax=Asparagus officinalis TaxID=4686 RepID=A0A5P1ELS6_ASPOF|nr:uncharacterized protein A4U43_C06F13940 [Asparagus officinalis]